MKKVFPILLLIGLAGFLYVKQVTSKLAFKVDAIRFDTDRSIAAGFTSLYFTVDMSVVNANPFSIDFNSYNIDFFYKGIKAGTITRRTGVQIVPGKVSTTSAVLQVPINTMASNLAKIISDITSGTPVTFDIKAAINARNFGVINYSTNYTV